MFYKSKHFSLDTATRTVRDENGKALYVTGNAYLMLEFLCKNQSSTVTKIGDALDREADLDEDDLRQLRYKIKTAVGHDVVLYKNHIYSVDGGVIAAEKGEPQIIQEPAPVQPVENKPTEPAALEPVEEPVRKAKQKPIVLAVAICLAVAVIGTAILFVSHRKQSLVSHQPVQMPNSEMILIHAGNFLMGSTEEQALEVYRSCQEGNQCLKEDYLAEYPQHKVLLPNFSIDKKEVSNDDYRLFTQATNHSVPAYWNDSNLNQPNQPVVGVNWYDAQSYCQWVAKRLPSEAEWEKTARGTDGRMWPWGNTWDPIKLNHGMGGEPGLDSSDGYTFTAPVGVALGVGPYGVYDIAGNAAEWVSDSFGPYQGNDKFGHSRYGQGLKVVKGGAYDSDPITTRAAGREYYDSVNRDIDVGFRCAKSK